MIHLLRIAHERGIRLNLDQPVPVRYQEPAKLKKLEAMRAKWKAHVGPDGRIHPHWSITDRGPIACHAPNLLTLPFEWIEGSGFLDVSVGSLEIILAAKLRGERDLADLILDHPDQAFSKLLAEMPDFTGLPRPKIKMAMYHLIYDMKPEDAEEAKAQTRILSLYPGMHVPRAEGIAIQLRSLVTDLVLTISQEVERTRGCQLVGFFHDTPLIESEGEGEILSTRFKGLSEDLLRCWSGVANDPIQRLKGLSTPRPRNLH